MCVMAFHSGQRWRVSGLLRGSDVTKRGVGRDVSQGTLGEEKGGSWQRGEETGDERKVLGGGGEMCV